MSYSDMVMFGMGKGMLVPISSYKAYIAVASRMNIEIVVENPTKKIQKILYKTLDNFEGIPEDAKSLYLDYS